MDLSDTLRCLTAADDFRKTVISTKKHLNEVKQIAHDTAANYASACQTLDTVASRLRVLKEGRGSLLAQIKGAKIYEFWIEFPGYAGPAKGASARLTQHGAIQQVSNVTGNTKGGLGGAAVGGLILGPVGAIVGAVVRRKTTIKTDVQTVDNRKLELELTVPGFGWSMIAAPEAQTSFRRFRDTVNARGTTSDDIKTFIAKQEALVEREQEITVTAKDALISAEKIVSQENATYDATWDKYVELRFPMLIDLRARWDCSGLPLRFVAITIGPLMMCAWVICILLSIISPASVPRELARTIVFLQIAIIGGAFFIYIVKVRLLK